MIGHVGSPSSYSEIRITLEEHAYSKGLVGNFCVIPFIQDGKVCFSVGQIVSIQLRNPYLERHSVEKIVSVRGEASPLTKEHDVLTVIFSPSSAYSMDGNRLLPTIMATVPSTGTDVYLLNQDIVNMIGEACGGVIYLGKMYNTDILLPMIFQHFGKVEEGGLGEAYHLGIFGKTGSGKSYLARMIMLSYLRHPEISILCLDPTGEYANEVRSGGLFNQILSHLGREFRVYDVTQISLTSIDAFIRVLLSSADIFLDRMGVRAEENRQNAARLIAEFFERSQVITTIDGRRITVSLSNAHDERVFNELMNYIRRNVGRIYVSQDAQRRVLDCIQQNRRRSLYRIWKPIAMLFSGEITIDNILRELIQERKTIIIDLSEVSARERLWNERIRAIVIDEIIHSLEKLAEEVWRKVQRSVNILVVIDEAHRLAPREKSEYEEIERLRQRFVDGVRTTRKYGLGWMFISQSLSSLHPELLRQMRIYFFGYGLSWGVEKRALEDLVGRGPHLDLYSNFRDPQTSAILGKKEYSFMAYGPVSPLSISGNPIFFNVLDYFTEFPRKNNLINE